MIKPNFIFRFSLGLLLFAASGRAQGPPSSIVADGVPSIPAGLAARVGQYVNTRSASFADWYPRQRSMLILTRFGDTNQVHGVQSPGSFRRQLTFYADRVSSARFSPRAGKDYFVFSMDTGGGEFFQLYLFDLGKGAVHLLTDGKSRNEGFHFNHRGTLAAYVSTRRDGTDFDLYTIDPENPGSDERALELKGAWMPLDWSPDDARLLLLKEVSVDESYLYVFNLAQGTNEMLTPVGAEKVFYGPAVWAKHRDGIYVVSDRGSEFRRVFYYDLATKKFTSYSDKIRWDVEGLALSPDGWTLAFIANADGTSEIHLLDVRTGRELPAPALSTEMPINADAGRGARRNEVSSMRLPKGEITGLRFHPLRNELAFSVNSAKSPSDVYSYDLTTKKLERWTFSETGGLNPQEFPEAQLVHYRTFDQVNDKPRVIAAYLTRPPARFKPPYPVLVNIHGGPEGQTRPTFRGRYNYFVNEMGLALVEPNVRGSTGYGKTFNTLDNGYLREDSVKDIGALLDCVAQQPDLDSKRVAVIGGSYGGYMSLATMTHYSGRLRCGIETLGVSNFVALLEHTESYRRDLRRVEYGDERDPKMRAFLESISPTSSPDKIKVPMLVAAGRNDPRVPYILSQEIVEKVRANGGNVWYILAKDEGHGYLRKPNVDYLQYAEALFLERYLLE